MRIDIEGLSYDYSRDVRVLHDINLSLEGPQLVCIIGPNGVGKSTLVKCMVRLLDVKNGKVRIDGKDVSEMKRRELAKKVGYVPSTGSDMFSIPVLDAIMIGRHNLQGWRNTEEDVDKVYGLMRLLEIEDLALRNYNGLSSGQHQKVSIARGLAMETEILILDEPTSNLDVKHQVYVTEMLRGVAREKGMMVVMISHDLNIAAKYADRIVVMCEPGRVYSYGAPREVVTGRMVRDVYGVDCEVRDEGGVPHVVLGSVMPVRTGI
ncbi:MAG: ABC transporter ATP-binding protein [archaeon]|nr:ABC transporter ATP-binding protein [archaeon]